MKFTYMGFSQQKLVEYGLDLVDTAILRYFIDFKDSGSMVMEIVEDKPYYWLEYDALIKDNPIIKIKSKDALRRRLKNMVDSGVLIHYHKAKGGSYSFYGVGDNYKYLLFDPTTQKSKGTTQNQHPCDSKVGGGTTQKSHPCDPKVVAKDSSTKHSSIKNTHLLNTHTKEEVEEVMCVLDKKVTFEEAKKLLTLSKSDIKTIKDKYEVVKTIEYRNLMAVMVKAITENWQMPKKQNESKSSVLYAKTRFHNFEQRTNNYTPDELEQKIHNNKNRSKNQNVPQLAKRE